MATLAWSVASLTSTAALSAAPLSTAALSAAACAFDTCSESRRTLATHSSLVTRVLSAPLPCIDHVGSLYDGERELQMSVGSVVNSTASLVSVAFVATLSTSMTSARRTKRLSMTVRGPTPPPVACRSSWRASPSMNCVERIFPAAPPAGKTNLEVRRC